MSLHYSSNNNKYLLTPCIKIQSHLNTTYNTQSLLLNNTITILHKIKCIHNYYNLNSIINTYLMYTISSVRVRWFGR